MSRSLHHRQLVPSILLILMTLVATQADAQPMTSLKGLKEGQVVEGFRAATLYLNDVGDAMGARFVHVNTGFTLDLLRLQSVPQSFIYVNSWPTSDMGEPHTQEHLLLGKGNKGRYVAGLEDAMLVGSSAFTQQWRTAYHFHTQGGADAYFTVLEKQLDALLHPDYTDEEIRREVANFGVVENPDGTLDLEEKGTVYNEMVSSFERPWSRMGRALNQSLYGASHPLTFVSGGLPEAIRAMKPEDIRRFHAATHHLANMGMVASFSRQLGVEETLRRIGGILDRVEPDGGRTMRFTTREDVAAPSMAPPGTITITEYPTRNASQPGPILMAWPANLSLDSDDRLLLNLFLQSFAGDATTNLYKRFVDSRTRRIDVGAKSVFAWVDNEIGYPIYVGFSDVDPSHMTNDGLGRIRSEVIDEINRVMSLLDDSPELRELNARVRSRIVESRRALAKFVNSPPRFGFRNSGSEWMEHLRDLEDVPGFAKSVTQREQLDRVEALLGTNRNIWPELIKRWGLVDRVPYVSAARPSPELIEREARDRQQRIAAEVARLRRLYGASSDQDAIKRYRAEYDATTRELDSLSAIAANARFIANPPLTLDDELDYKVDRLADGTPVLHANFEDMTSATVGIAVKLGSVAPKDLFYLSLLPELLTQTGVMINGKGLPYEEMSERLRREILGVGGYFSTNFTTGRAELVMTASGNDVKEADRAIEWMGMMLTSPYWSEKNIGRLRDVVEQRLSSLRNTMQSREEAWVNDPAFAYWRQNDPLALTTSSFLTRAHNALRLKWLLRDPGNAAARQSITSWLQRLESVTKGMSRAELQTLFNVIAGDASATLPAEQTALVSGALALTEPSRANALDLVQDLEHALSDIPDNSLNADMGYLVREIRSDLLVDPLEAMRKLDDVRRGLLKKSAVRTWMVGSRASQAKLAPKLEALLATFTPGPYVPARYQSERMIVRRIRERSALTSDPLYVGLVNPSTSSGVFLNSAPGTSYTDTDREALLDFLATMLYSGGAGHGIFMKTWAAGLAYSNGIRISPRSGRIVYYAERVPVLPQTLQFVIDELRKAKPDTALVDYAIAQAFQESRAASSFESRGEAMAADIADGLDPEVIRTFRRAILALRNEPGLAEELVRRMPGTVGRVLPGYGPKAATVDDGVFYVIGPDEQIEKYEEYLETVDGSGTQVHRLYPRDYWMVGEEGVQP
jgi:Zn-dependent M16 (insulinase) family peptidase